MRSPPVDADTVPIATGTSNALESITLDQEQRAAVEHGDGPLLIVAGAGTGKTTVIARRIAHLIASKRARPSEILALTFNDKAAAEMEERVDLLVPYGYADVTIQTFHAFGENVLAAHGLEIGIAPGFSVLDATSQALFLAERIDELGLRHYRPLSDPTRFVTGLAGFFSRAKDDPQWPEDIRRAAAEKLDRAAVARAAGGPETASELAAALEDQGARLAELAEAYERYDQLLWRAGFLDFGDLLALTHRLFQESPAALKRIQERYRYVLVDEFQDTNPVQFKIVRRLVEAHRNLVVVGDDDQSIYRFRGAHLKNILEFREHYPEAKEIVLRRNYRSTRQILARSRALIVQNRERLEVRYGISKELQTEKEGPDPIWREFEGEADEAAWVADEIAAAVREKRRRPRDVAILVRNNRHAEPFLRALDERGLPYYFSGSRGLFQRPEIKELISLLQSLFQDSRPEFLYLLASEAYGVPEDDLTKLMHVLARQPAPLRALFRRAAAGRDGLELSDEGRERLGRLLEDVEALQEFARGRRTGEVLYHYLERRGILKDLMAGRTFEDEARARNIVKFFALIRSFEKVALADRVALFLRHFEAVREFGEDPAVADLDEASDVVQVLTIHRAKGLEFPVVYLVQMATHRFPTASRVPGIEPPRETEDEDPSASHLEEERRLGYVAFTRAREELIVTYARDYGGRQKRKASPFLAEAFDIGKTPPARARRRVIDEIADQKLAAATTVAPAPARATAREPLKLSYKRLEDYETCPLKYRLLHALSVNPILTADHRVNFGNAVHRAVAFANQRRLEGVAISEAELIEVFRSIWRSEGYRNEEHERQRFAQGAEALHAFHAREIESGPPASAIERHFRVKLGDVVITGSMDRVDEGSGGVTLVDYKTSEKDDLEKADEASRRSLQLSVYALAYRELEGRLPDRLELRYVLTGVTGVSTCDEERVAKAHAKIEEIAAAIRAEAFEARPDARRCSICACRPVCRESAV